MQEETRPNADDVRTEYTALVNFHNSVVTYRFTLVGFYLATIGLIVGKEVKFLEACLIIGITVAMYMMELRNRTLYMQMGERAMYIERRYWGLNRAQENDTGLPLFSTMRQNDLPEDIKSTLTKEQIARHKEKPKFWRSFDIPVLQASHSKGLDLLYLVVASYAILRMVFC